MSLRSYRRNVERGVTGSEHDTCLPASFERISAQHSLSPDFYIEYETFIVRYNAMNPSEQHRAGHRYAKLFDRLAEQLSGYSCQDMIFYRPQSKAGYLRRVGSLASKGYRIVMELALPEANHAVGLVTTGQPDVFKLVSNWTPRQFYGQVALSQLYEHLVDHSDYIPSPRNGGLDYQFNYTNIMALPPED